jgi:hypothetical protein
MIPKIITGDLNRLEVELTVNGVAIAIDPAASVKVALVSTGNDMAYTSPVTQVWNAPGAVWAEGIVSVEIPGSATAAITYQGAALLEVQVDPGSAPNTWFVPVQIIRGQIA